MTSLEKMLDAKSDLMMRKLDEILNGALGRSVPTPGSTHARLMMEMEQAAMPVPSKVRERTTNLGIGSGPGQPPRGLSGRN